MDKEIEDIKNRLSNIENKLDKILLTLDSNLIENCNKMGDHIEFVENVYDTVKKPLDFVLDKINTISNIEYKQLPECKKLTEK